MTTQYDVAIIGGGAAGMMAAIHSARAGSSCILYEATKQHGNKILISGGGHCNLTNTAVAKNHFNSDKVNAAFNVIKAFDHTETQRFFTTHGIPLTADSAGRILPQSNSSRDIQRTLLANLKSAGVRLYTECRVSNIAKKQDFFHITHPGGTDIARTVIITTGGKSYPETGSTGDGYRFAAAFGHTVMPLAPGLSAIKIKGHPLASLEGISLRATLTLKVHNKTVQTYSGDLLITHDGISGPVALNVSRHCAMAAPHDPTLFVSFIDHTFSEKELIAAASNTPTQHVRTFVRTYVPNRLADHLLAQATIQKDTKFSSLTKEQRKLLYRLLTAYCLPVAAVHGYTRAEVTAGGIPFTELRTKTLESKIVPGLFFAGEVCDVDGIMGGYNLQWAWSSGIVAARGALTYYNA